MLNRIVSIILPVFLIVGLGFFYGRRRRPDMTVFNAIALDVATPLLLFSAMASKNFDLVSHSVLLLGGVAVVLGSGFLAWPVAKLFRLQTATFVPPMMFNNSGNMGLPLAFFAYGSEGLAAAIPLFVLTSLMHFTLGVRMVSGHTDAMTILKHPIVIATLLGIIVSMFGIHLPETPMQAVKIMGESAIPLMLFSLGVRMISIDLKSWHLGLLAAIVSPVSGLLVAVLFAEVFDLPGQQRGMLILFASLPPAVINFLVAERYRQEPDKVAAIVLFGNLGAIFFVPLALTLALR